MIDQIELHFIRMIIQQIDHFQTTLDIFLSYVLNLSYYLFDFQYVDNNL